MNKLEEGYNAQIAADLINKQLRLDKQCATMFNEVIDLSIAEHIPSIFHTKPHNYDVTNPSSLVCLQFRNSTFSIIQCNYSRPTVVMLDNYDLSDCYSVSTYWARISDGTKTIRFEKYRQGEELMNYIIEKIEDYYGKSINELSHGMLDYL